MEKLYIGLDIGTESCGIAAADERYKLIRHKGHDLWAVRMFEEALTKEQRRMSRTSRHRMKRRAQRIRLLHTLFEREIAKADPYFFARMSCGAYHLDDLTARDLKKCTLFNDQKYTDKEFYSKYPTIFHLRAHLMQNGADDIRELYLAVHHILKYRGHFLIESENVSDTQNLKTVLEVFNKCFEDYREDAPLLALDKLEELETFLKGPKFGINKTKEEVFKYLNAQKREHEAWIRLICGGKIATAKLFENPEYKDITVKDLDFSKEIDEDELKSAIQDDEFSLYLAAKAAYSCFALTRVLRGQESLSGAMVAIYDKHRQDLKRLKDLIKSSYPESYNEIFRRVVKKEKIKDEDKEKEKKNFVNYCNLVTMCSRNGKKVKVDRIADMDEFYKFIAGILTAKEP